MSKLPTIGNRDIRGQPSKAKKPVEKSTEEALQLFTTWQGASYYFAAG